MAFKLDNDLLEELGLAALSASEKQAMLRQILETLEMRVGTTLASRMSEAQLDEFERLMPTEGDSQDAVQQKEQQALQWLESNFPNYKQVVNDELEKLKAEIKQTAPQIVAASTAALSGVTDQAQPPYSQPDMNVPPQAMPQPSYDQNPAPSLSPQPQPGYAPVPQSSPVAPSAQPAYQPAPNFAGPMSDVQINTSFTPPPAMPTPTQNPFQPVPPGDNPPQNNPFPPQQPPQQ